MNKIFCKTSEQKEELEFGLQLYVWNERRKASDMKESTLQRDVEKYLATLYTDGRIQEWYHRPDRAPGRGERRGLPDILIAVRQGVVLAIELKIKSEITAKQACWLRCFDDNGTVCRTLDEVQEWLERKIK